MTTAEQLQQLADLHARGALSDDEFARAKAQVIAGTTPASGYASRAAVNAANGLQRIRSESWLGGVCAGIGRVTGLDAWVWRLIFTLSVLLAGTGVLLYVLLWVFVPAAPEVQRASMLNHSH